MSKGDHLGDAGSGKYLIKRYSNRKLYDTVRGKFTTLDQVAELVEGGVEVVVLDHDTGVDRTEEVLAQVLSRQARSAPGGRSNLLADLLRTSTGVAKSLLDGVSALDVNPEAGEASASSTSGKSGADRAGSSSVADVDSDAGAKADGSAGHVERQEAEIRELRDQVSQLTQAVAALLDQNANKSGDH
ncbi:polyhydroxyalkanoate synthesis regulator DNA-binding domain-containing protein [Nocardia sp. FBN12]|uniref:polyhydroxyalkanoate synthesis regulator DNA-binding domain-containing protein n=1 Tax=Nocardia sp. FBN12 TaxID=3419766 RepID=UPI003D0750F8